MSEVNEGQVLSEILAYLNHVDAIQQSQPGEGVLITEKIRRIIDKVQVSPGVFVEQQEAALLYEVIHRFRHDQIKLGLDAAEVHTLLQNLAVVVTTGGAHTLAGKDAAAGAAALRLDAERINQVATLDERRWAIDDMTRRWTLADRLDIANH